MKVTAVMNFATLHRGFEAGREYEMEASAAKPLIRSGHLEEVKPAKKATTKKAAEKATVETATAEAPTETASAD